jgi:4-carboxymuconolactone decarboxylase
MARLPLIDPSEDGAAGELLRRITGERGRTFNVYRALANSPGVLERVYALASYLWNESALAPQLQELVILRVAQLTDSDYEWARHRPIARRAGVPDEKVEALARWRAHPDSYDALERAVLALTEEATRDIEASQETVAAVHAVLGERGTLEVLTLAGFYGMVARLLRSLAVDGEPGDEPMPR